MMLFNFRVKIYKLHDFDHPIHEMLAESIKIQEADKHSDQAPISIQLET